ncbi:MAG: hypothetical protein FJ125_16365, partial [Deltaproteobacteria bacterium]|nr:hypothetical protein [Deltaproteobacteria bacterium]
MSKNILPNGPVLALLVLLASALPGSAALAQPAPGGEVQPQQQLKPPPPPPTLRAWVEYALRARPPQDDCPLLRPDGVADPQPVCAAIVRARLEGDPRAGQLSVSLTGRSWSNNPVILPLLGPASVFSVEETAPLPGVKLAPPLLLGSVHGTDVWAARLEPGEFAFRILLRFDPRPAVELQLPGPIAELQSALSSGFLRLDETERAWHGGALQIETGHEAAAAAEEPLTVR